MPPNLIARKLTSQFRKIIMKIRFYEIIETKWSHIENKKRENS